MVLTAFSNKLGQIVSFVIWPSADEDDGSTVMHINLPSIGWNGSWSSITVKFLKSGLSIEELSSPIYFNDE